MVSRIASHRSRNSGVPSFGDCCPCMICWSPCCLCSYGWDHWVWSRWGRTGRCLHTAFSSRNSFRGREHPALAIRVGLLLRRKSRQGPQELAVEGTWQAWSHRYSCCGVSAVRRIGAACLCMDKIVSDRSPQQGAVLWGNEQRWFCGGACGTRSKFRT